jgi:hypothetical protein
MTTRRLAGKDCGEVSVASSLRRKPFCTTKKERATAALFFRGADDLVCGPALAPDL